MGYFSQAINFRPSRRVKSFLNDRLPLLDPLRCHRAKGFFISIGEDSAACLQDGYVSRQRIQVVVGRQREATWGRYIDLLVRAGILVAVSDGAWRIVDFERHNFSRASHSANEARRNHPQPDYFDPIGPSPDGQACVKPDMRLCIEQPISGQESQKAPRRRKIEEQEENTCLPLRATSPAEEIAHRVNMEPRTAPVPPMPAEVLAQCDAVAEMAPPTTRPLPEAALRAARSLGLAVPTPAKPSSVPDEPPAAVQAPPEPPSVATDPPPNEHEMLSAVQALEGPDVLHERVADIRRELSRTKVSAKELWSATEAAKAFGSGARSPVAVLFGLLRRRRTKAAAQKGDRPLLPELRRLQTFAEDDTRSVAGVLDEPDPPSVARGNGPGLDAATGFAVLAPGALEPQPGLVAGQRQGEADDEGAADHAVGPQPGGGQQDGGGKQRPPKGAKIAPCGDFRVKQDLAIDGLADDFVQLKQPIAQALSAALGQRGQVAAGRFGPAVGVHQLQGLANTGLRIARGARPADEQVHRIAAGKYVDDA